MNPAAPVTTTVAMLPGLPGGDRDGISTPTGDQLVECRERPDKRIDLGVGPVGLLDRREIALARRRDRSTMGSTPPKEDLHVSEVDAELGELGEKPRIRAPPGRTQADAAQHPLQLPRLRSVDDV